MSASRNLDVGNVIEAVELAQKLKQDGDYDWFRGQIKSWPLKSSFLRLDQEKRAQALEKLRRFESWVRNTAGLESLTANTNSMVAVGQHYGLPTNFIDFTTSPEIAGFFASCGEQTEEDQLSCILCLNTKDLMEFWKILPAKYPPPELIAIDVQNLWRLQAQHGTFLYCPYTNNDKIFPKRKSQLEILLDQYFMNEQLIEGERNLPESIKKFTMFIPSRAKYDPEVFIGNNPPSKLDSWSRINLQPWISAKHEIFFEAITETGWEIVIDLNKDINSIRREVRNYITGLLQVIWTPDRLFEFDRLSKLFAQEIVPVQVLMRSEASAIFFSPARLDSFGLP
jgi:hypothetical protein